MSGDWRNDPLSPPFLAPVKVGSTGLGESPANLSAPGVSLFCFVTFSNCGPWRTL